jgi:hypothetical protein
MKLNDCHRILRTNFEKNPPEAVCYSNIEGHYSYNNYCQDSVDHKYPAWTVIRVDAEQPFLNFRYRSKKNMSSINIILKYHILFPIIFLCFLLLSISKTREFLENLFFNELLKETF